MKCVRLTLLIVTFLLFSTATTLSKESLVVYGDHFHFLVSEPAEWQGFVKDAYKYRINAYFCLPGQNFDNAPAVMYIRVLSKNGYSVDQSLTADMRDFSLRKNNVVYTDLEVEGLPYRYAAKQYLIDNRNIDYLCYVDPGGQQSYYVIFVLSGPKDISPGYLDDFQSLVRSFQWGGEAATQR